jgi:hypothetical protein
LAGSIANDKLTNSSITINGSAVALGGSVSLAGDIESVTASTGLSGGGSTGALTLTNTMATAIDAKGDLVVGTGADTFSKLGVGANGTVLTAASGEATGLSWATPAAGGMTLISTTTLSAATTISFTSIPTTYKSLRFVFIACRSTSGYWQATVNNDTAGNYQSQASAAAVTGGNSTNTSAGVGATDGRLGIIPGTFNGLNNGSCNGYMQIDNYTSTTLQRTGVWQCTGWDGTYFCATGAFNYNSTGTAITRVDFVRSSTQTLDGIIQLWGIA